ncbi:E3 ubiquitin-protein ligase [Sesbania bispinosa]|nr:E3 ubiquitin-protein ligase [Sesbania bispinosa]
MAESTNTDLNGEQASSEQAQKQFLIPGGPTNVSFPPMGHYHSLPSQTQTVPVNYGEGFGNDPNNQSSQLEAHRKFLQWQIEFQNMQRTKADRNVDDGTSSSASGSRLISSSSSVSGHGYHEEIQDGKHKVGCVYTRRLPM